MNKACYLLLTIVVVAVSCRTPKDLVYQDVDHFSLQKAGLKQTIVVLDIRLYNPNNYRLKLKNADLDVFLNGNHLGKMTVKESTSFIANDITELPVILDVDLMNVLPNAFQILINKEVTIKLSGNIRAGRHGLFINVPINYEGKQDLLSGIR